MSSRRPLISALLALALLAGQWLAAAHDSDHGQQAGAADGCVACVYAHGAGAGALPAVPQLALALAAEMPDVAPAGNPLAAALRDHPIRGPPALLA